MTPKENLYYALGELAYAAARCDGRIQKDELNKLHGILESELQLSNDGPNIADIIFHILNKDNVSSEQAYENAMKDVALNSHYLSPELKLSFLRVIEKVAHAFPPALHSEKEFVARLRKDISAIQGDPVFYNN